MITLKQAKRMSLKKWKAILGAYPSIKKMENIGARECGFCSRHLYEECENCELYPKICYNGGMSEIGESSLYWRIINKLSRRDLKDLRIMIEQMIKAIEEVKEDDK